MTPIALWIGLGFVLGFASAVVVVIVAASAMDPSYPGDAIDKENRNG